MLCVFTGCVSKVSKILQLVATQYLKVSFMYFSGLFSVQ